jgi:vanadium chloroperoxidase
MGDAGILAWEVKYRDELWRPVLGVRNHDKSICSMDAANATDNLDADCDPFWLPLGAPNSNTNKKNFTPPFPAYPSGHATFGAAALHIIRLYLGTPKGDREPDKHLDGMAFVSDEMNGITTDNKGTVRPKHLRSFPKGIWQMIVENGLSRIFLGVHWYFDAFARDSKGNIDLYKNVGGIPLGFEIADDIFFNSKIKK